MPHAVVTMGVSGSGKSTIGSLLAERLGARFVDADDLHPAANRAKMAAGIPLTDDDRGPWLRLVGDAIREEAEAGRSVVVACSALRRTYRELIVSSAGREVMFVHLAGTQEAIADRMAARRDHFMPASLLNSQLATLEPLTAGERGFSIENTAAPEEIVRRIELRLTTDDEAAKPT